MSVELRAEGAQAEGGCVERKSMAGGIHQIECPGKVCSPATSVLRSLMCWEQVNGILPAVPSDELLDITGAGERPHPGAEGVLSPEW